MDATSGPKAVATDGRRPAPQLRVGVVTGDKTRFAGIERLLGADERFSLVHLGGLATPDDRPLSGRCDVVLVDDALEDAAVLERLVGSAATVAGPPVVIAKTGPETRDAVSSVVEAPLEAGPLATALINAAERHRVRTLAHLAAIVESSTDAIFSRTLDGTILSWNPGAERMFGYRAADVIGSHVVSLVAPNSTHLVPMALERIRAGGSVSQLEIDCLRQDGTPFPAMVSVSPLRDADGTLIGAATVVHDVTERRGFQAALAESEAEYRSTFDEAPVGIAHLTLEGRIIRANRRILQMFGLAKVTERITFDRFVHPDDRDIDRDAGQRLYRGAIQRHVVEKRYLRADGTPFWGHVTTSVHRDASGRPRYLIAMVEDVSERRLLEQQLSQAQKMEAVGRLAGGVAHDFNNLLTAILGFADLTLERLGPTDGARDDVQQILNAAHTAAALTGQLLAFSRKQLLLNEQIDLNAVVEDTRALLGRVIGEDIALVTHRPAEPCWVFADRGQVTQVIMNLAVNARDAMPDGGTLTIATGPGGAGAVELVVTDTGVGIEPTVIEKIFEPFFTTKEQGKGTGLGLATVYGIVQQSGGSIAVESVPGNGTTFRIGFPRTEGRADPRPVPAAGEARTRGGETVLFVEDQREVRDVIRRTLEARGYRTLEADSGAAALDLLERHDGRIDLLLTDVVMPGLGGRELAQQIGARCPGVTVLYMSGYTGEAISRGGVLDQGIDLIRKPFVPDELARRVRAALDARRPGASSRQG